MLSPVMICGMFGVAETKRRFAEILDRALEGERVIVTRRGEPVAAIVPLRERRDETSAPPQDPEPERHTLGLGAFTAAMAGWHDLDEVVATAVTSRAVARDRRIPELD